MRIIETQDLTKIYTTGLKKGNIIALDSFSLGVNQGEVFGLLGPNGAGKTTLVKTLLGITSLTSGEALINGLPPRDPGSREKVGFLPENPRFPYHLTAGTVSGCQRQEPVRVIDLSGVFSPLQISKAPSHRATLRKSALKCANWY